MHGVCRSHMQHGFETCDIVDACRTKYVCMQTTRPRGHCRRAARRPSQAGRRWRSCRACSEARTRGLYTFAMRRKQPYSPHTYDAYAHKASEGCHSVGNSSLPPPAPLAPVKASLAKPLDCFTRHRLPLCRVRPALESREQKGPRGAQGANAPPTALCSVGRRSKKLPQSPGGGSSGCCVCLYRPRRRIITLARLQHATYKRHGDGRARLEQHVDFDEKHGEGQEASGHSGAPGLVGASPPLTAKRTHCARPKLPGAA